MNIAIYCGSTKVENKAYETEAKKLINEIKNRGKYGIVYGGSKQGLMGTISLEALRLGINTTGVITHKLSTKELENEKLKTLHKVTSMRERKQKMEELSDIFIAMPGGLGTFDEIFEILCLAQIGNHKKACAFFNINGYYDKLLDFLYHCVDEGFIPKRHIDMIIVSDNPSEILDMIENYKSVKTKWEV